MSPVLMRLTTTASFHNVLSAPSALLNSCTVSMDTAVRSIATEVDLVHFAEAVLTQFNKCGAEECESDIATCIRELRPKRTLSRMSAMSTSVRFSPSG